MYLYIENNIFINLEEIELLIDYNDFMLKSSNKKIIEHKKSLI